MFKLYDVLRGADMAVMTEKMIRAELSAAFGGLDVSDKKALIKEHVRGAGARWGGGDAGA